jgi:uncharacterized membrane protein
VTGTIQQPDPQHATARKNVAAICQIEEDALRARTLGERLGDTIARHAGRVWFIAVHAVWFGIWIMANTDLLPVRAFDPFPFQFLTLVVSLEAIFLSLFILMSQNRAQRQADARAHLDLQINLLAEQEATKMLQLLQRLCIHHGVAPADDPELQYLQNPTEPSELLDDLKKGLPENG